MKKKIFIINGSGGVGKDTFVSLVSQNANFKVLNFSSVDKVKEIAKQIGWDGVSKTEKDRKFLSDLKLLATEYNDMPLNSIIEFANQYKDDEAEMLFIHIREPLEINRAKEMLSYDFDVKTILVKRNTVNHIVSNMADANVYNYDYDIEIKNDGTLSELNDVAKYFINDELKYFK